MLVIHYSPLVRVLRLGFSMRRHSLDSDRSTDLLLQCINKRLLQYQNQHLQALAHHDIPHVI